MNTMTARELRQRVAARFGKTSEAVSFPEYVVLFEVPIVGRPRTPLAEGESLDDYPIALRSRQRLDVVAVGVWNRTSHLVHGFEVKVSRADLLHELRDLTKSEYAARAVDRFWLVLGDRTLMRDTDPIPESWGILYASGRGLRLLREPGVQEGSLDRTLIVGMVTRALIAPRIGTQVRYRDGLMHGLNQVRELVTAAETRGYSRGQREAKWANE